MNDNLNAEDLEFKEFQMSLEASLSNAMGSASAFEQASYDEIAWEFSFGSVSMSLRGPMGEPRINLGFLDVKEDRRGQGLGSRVLSSLCEVTDRFGMEIDLVAQPYEHPIAELISSLSLDEIPQDQLNSFFQERERLVAWYAKQGFEAYGNASDLDFPMDMIRPASAPKVTPKDLLLPQNSMPTTAAVAPGPLM